MAVPDELIDAVSIVGPRDHARERIRAYRDAGVDTLIVAPTALDNETRRQQLRLVAELANEVG
jgi:alkanesulfonate monooxygenase SsuD/methylene tetrahydromethanopterin reductase-like flavin-dependent oxidoreductase (luciferase family)